jgi:PXPV repeat (3 copies)
MKRLAAVALLSVVLLPGVAFASSATDAALGLGAFAVFNQILGGVGIFGAARPVVVAPAPVVVAPPPPVYVAPAPPVYYAPPRPVYVAPAPVYVAPRPVVVYRKLHPHAHWRHHHAGHWRHR